MDITADDPRETTTVPPPAQTPTAAPVNPASTIAALTRLLTHELTSAAACRDAVAWFDHQAVAATLRGVMDGHHLRAGVLFEAIRAHAGHPPVDPHGHGDPAVQPALADAGAVLTLLLELEQRGVAGYREALQQLDDLTRVQIEAELLPAQERALASVAGVQIPAPDGAV